VNQAEREYFLAQIRSNLLAANTEILKARGIDTAGDPLIARAALADIRQTIREAISYALNADSMALAYRTRLEENHG
jgi:hypothetical protein